MPDRLTQSGLHIASAITLSVYAHSLETLVWFDPASRCAAYDYQPGELPAITLAAGELKHSRDPVLLDHKSEPGPRWFGNYQRGWWHAREMVIDFEAANYGAHVVWQVDFLPAPSFICGGSHDVTFDGREDLDDLRRIHLWVGQQDHRGDWNEDGEIDVFDLAAFMEGF